MMLARICLLLLINVSLFAQNSSFEGSWAGDIKLPDNSRLGVIFHLEGSDKAMKCKMDVPLQGAKGMQAEKTSINSNTIEITFPTLKASYMGTREDDEIKGTWTQGGMALPLNLEWHTGETVLDRPQHPKPPFNYDIAEINIDINAKKGAYQLAGTLTTPKGEGPFPLAVLVTGSGPQDRDETIFDHKPFWVIADFLTNNGIAVFRYDDRGVGKSTGTFKGCTTEDFTNDALQVVQNIARMPSIDSEKVGIIGHSEGGLIASIAASKSDAVKFTILLAGPAVSGKQILKRQIADIQIAEGVAEEKIQKESQVRSDVIDFAASKGTNESRLAAARTRLKSFYDSNYSEEEKKSIGDFENYFEVSTQGLFNDWMNYFLNIEPKKYIERIKCPTLAIFGNKDQQVSIMDNMSAMRAALRAAPVEDYKIELLSNVNHLFQHSKTGKPSEYGTLAETFAREGLVMMRDWINERFKVDTFKDFDSPKN